MFCLFLCFFPCSKLGFFDIKCFFVNEIVFQALENKLSCLFNGKTADLFESGKLLSLYLIDLLVLLFSFSKFFCEQLFFLFECVSALV